VHGVLEYFPTNKNTNGQLHACDALNIFFELEKPPIEQLDSFIFLSKEGGELQCFFKTLN
jgi:hypothetical protein